MFTVSDFQSAAEKMIQNIGPISCDVKIPDFGKVRSIKVENIGETEDGFRGRFTVKFDEATAVFLANYDKISNEIKLTIYFILVKELARSKLPED